MPCARSWFDRLTTNGNKRLPLALRLPMHAPPPFGLSLSKPGMHRRSAGLS